MSNLVDHSQKVLQVKNLKKYFKVGSGNRKLMVPAVDNITIDVYKREVFGVVGESGSGKTTLGRTIIKLYEPTEGSVTLNNIMISAGYADHLAKIAELKKQAKLDILALSPEKWAVAQRKLKEQELVASLHSQIQQLRHEEHELLRSIRHDHDQYRTQQYRLKSQLTIDTESAEFEFLQKRKEIISRSKNQAQLKLQAELSIAELKFARKHSGIKDSAALSKEIISQRLAALKQEHDATIKQLNESYVPLIADAEKAILSKEQVETEIHKQEVIRNSKIVEATKKYHAEVALLVKPDEEEFHDKVQATSHEFALKISAITKEIAAVKLSKPSVTSDISTTVAMSPQERSQRASQIKQKYLQLISEQRKMINEIKRVNKSKDTLRESQKMQMIFQDPISSLNPRMTVREIIGEGLTIQGGYTKQQIADKVEEVLELVGLAPEYATRYPHEFSGGQRQRIGVARALIMQPNVIIADEPISALDVSIRAQVINLLSNLREQLGLTILFIAHDLSVVRFFCDRIAVMHNGKVVELASSEELFKHPMHAYTVSLLSAIPQPDPDYEKNRTRIHYNPSSHDYRSDKPTLREIAPGHSVYANQAEFDAMKIKYSEFLASEGKE